MEILPVIYELIDEFEFRLRARVGRGDAASTAEGEPKPAAANNHG